MQKNYLNALINSMPLVFIISDYFSELKSLYFVLVHVQRAHFVIFKEISFLNDNVKEKLPADNQCKQVFNLRKTINPLSR